MFPPATIIVDMILVVVLSGMKLSRIEMLLIRNLRLDLVPSRLPMLISRPAGVLPRSIVSVVKSSDIVIDPIG